MTNIYFLYKGSSPPSPYQVKATWDGKYLRFTNDVGNHGSIGGNLTHDHETDNEDCSDADLELAHGATGGSYYGIVQHDHYLENIACSGEDNDPSYYQLKLIYMDLAEWEATQKCIPQDAVVLSDAVLSAWSEVTRLSAADGKLIKLGTAETTGGIENHDHVVTGDLADGGPIYGAARLYGVSGYVGRYTDLHDHDFELSSGSSSLKPASVQTRLYYAPSATTKARAGMIAFVDGAPSANWNVVDWNDRFLESANSNPTLTGSDTHDHLSLSGESDSFNDRLQCYIDDNIPVCDEYHIHEVELDLVSGDHKPLYVSLYPVKLLVTLQRSGKSFAGIF